MISTLKLLMRRPIYRYLIIGGSVYVFELVVIAIALHNGGSAVFAVGLSFWLGLIVSFVLQKIITFSDTRLHHTVLLPQVIAFSALVLFNFGFTLLVTKLLSPWLPARSNPHVGTWHYDDMEFPSL